MKTQDLINTLLEIYHVINYDGFYNDREALKGYLLKFGVSEETISYHEKKQEV